MLPSDMIERLHAEGAAMTLDDARWFVAELVKREIDKP
jgi:hypothetical protein